MASYQATVLANSPVAYWPCQETSGTSLADVSGGGHNLTAHGTFTLGVATGLAGVGKGITWGGSIADYASVAKFAAIDITGNVTYEAWINATSFAAGGNIIMAAGATGVGAQGYEFYAFLTGAKGDLKMSNQWTNSTIYQSTTSPFFVATLYHVVVTYTSGVQSNGYVNGVALESPQGSVVVTTTNTEPFCVAARSTSGVISVPFVGLITQVAVYNTVLSAADVAAHYAARNSTGSSPGKQTSPGQLVSALAHERISERKALRDQPQRDHHSRLDYLRRKRGQ